MTSVEEALREGINCVSLAHLVIGEIYGVTLPQSYKCFEMFCDTEYFEKDDEIIVGDLVWFGIKDANQRLKSFRPSLKNGELTNWSDCPVKHVGICVDDTMSSEQTILHATNVEKTNALWPLDAFARHRRYAEVCGVSRLKI